MGGRRHGAGALRNGLAEGGLRLRMSDVVDGAPIVPHSCRRGTMAWSNSYTGKGSGAVWYQVEAEDDAGTMTVRLALPGMTTAKVQDIALVASPQPRGGGVRWFFVCPRTAALCIVLHCPAGASSFAGRKAWRLSYLSQRRSLRDRPLERARAIRVALGGSANMMEPFPPKPKWMRWPTYERQRAKADAAHRASLASCTAWLDKIKPGWREGRGFGR